MNISKVLNSGERDFNYVLAKPEKCDKELPLLVYLHGAGERGKKIDNLNRHAIPKMLSEGAEINAVVLCPQCPAGYVWHNLVFELKTLIDKIVSENEIRHDRILLTGSSMGGYGAWEMGLTYRNFFAAIAPVAGGGTSWRCRNFKTTPVLAYHGKLDITVPPECSVQMVDAVNKNGGSATLTVLEEYGHNDGIDYVYAETVLIENLLKYRRTDFTYIPDVCEGMF